MKKASPFAVVILAAGKGTRMKSDTPKVMHEIAGLPILNWLIDRVQTLEPEKIIVVTAPGMDDVVEAAATHQCVIQKEQLGTGDAVKPAMAELKDFDGKVLVLLGDEPFVDTDILHEMLETESPSVMAIEPPSNEGLGRVLTDEDFNLVEIVEQKDCNEEQKKITLSNAGNFCFPAKELVGWLDKIDNDNAQGEYYLPDVPKVAAEEGVKTKVIQAKTSMVWGINTKSELADHEIFAQILLRERAMENGVTMIDPDSVTLSYDTQFEEGVTLEPNIFFGKGVRIGKGVTIHAFSYIAGSEIEEGAEIGPFARIRPKSHIGKKASVGNFIEINRSIIEEGAKAKHVSYIGDTILGEKSNVGAGTIIANYDGFFKHQSKIGKNVFIGSNSTVISPVQVGDNAIIAAGSNVNKDIPGNAMAIGRSRQENHLGWASEYRSMKQQAKDESKK
ncbi:MAG: bifunctional UDP-N-acetylglucosamine diphosphorylase/glucosamine-1-phosphate N-acetyltransferase GlmU [Pseudomonadota bacterium]